MRPRTAFAVALFAVSCSREAIAAPAYAGRVLYALGANLPAGFTDYDVDEAAGQTAGGGRVAGAGYYPLPDGTRSLRQGLYWTAAGVAVNLNPTAAGSPTSTVEGVFGTQQVGFANSVNRNGNDHALLWTGTAASYVDLNPSPTGPLGYIDNSFAEATDGVHQVGSGYGDTTNGSVHALLWSGTAASAVDLAPTKLAGYEESFAYGVRGTQQVGLAYGTATNQNFHAMLWTGTAASAVDLNPTNLGAIDTSFLNDTTGTQQVGAISGDATGGDTHAAIWSGTAGSAVDLNPAGVANSVVNGTNGTVQVGVGFADAGDEVNHALLWTGTAASAVDLEALLPAAGAWQLSDAYTIDANGTAYGLAYGTYDGTTDLFAVAWSPVPEPGVVGMIAVVATALVRRPRR